MGIREICDKIVKYFENKMEPFPQISRTLLICSMIRRPGLSVIKSTANIVKDLSKLGIPTGPMPDGSPNLTVGFCFASTKEIYRGIKKDASIQVGIQGGTPNVVVKGANSGGAFVAAGTIQNNNTQAYGQMI